jgi:endonuclease YncB( thermonuclease family)
MRRGGFVLVLVVALSADAAPTPQLSWADWVGDWSGKLKWTGCTIDGEPKATLSFDALDGALAIDLAPAGGALGPLSLVEDGAGFLGKSGDVTVRLARKTDTLDLAVEQESGCTVHATLKRPSIGIAECDALDSWARIEEHCSKLAKPRLENLARLVRQRVEWTKARGDARSTLATQCKARATKVEAELAEAGCAPDPNPVSARGPECLALRQTAAKLSRCGTLPFDLATSLAHDANQLASSIEGVEGDTSIKVIEKQCKQMRSQITEAAQQAGCAL